MRKRPSRPQRFAAIDNEAIDTLPSMLAVGMLTAMIRAKDGDDVTVAKLCEKYAEGREAVTKTMRVLVEAANVVKFKIQRAANEVVINEDGEEEVKRGGSWYTTFSVDSIPFTAADVAEMVQEIVDAGNVKAMRVEPEHLDPRKDRDSLPRPRYGNPSVGPTRGNADPAPSPDTDEADTTGAPPTDGFPTVGGPTVGRPAALYRKKTVLSLSAAGPDSDPKQREKDQQQQDTPSPLPEQRGLEEEVVSAYVMAHMAGLGLPPRPDVVQRIRTEAAALIGAGRTVKHLVALAAAMPAKGWQDLIKQASKNPDPKQPAPNSKPWCGDCNDGEQPMAAAQRMRWNDALEALEKCECHPGYTPTPVNA